MQTLWRDVDGTSTSDCNVERRVEPSSFYKDERASVVTPSFDNTPYCSAPLQPTGTWWVLPLESWSNFRHRGPVCHPRRGFPGQPSQCRTRVISPLVAGAGCHSDLYSPVSG